MSLPKLLQPDKMTTLNLNLENCYGIRKLQHKFNFDKHKNCRGASAFSIYAPNGVMKSSLARTFDDYSKEESSKDLIFSNRETLREIQWNESELDPKNIFVIKPYVESYESEAVSTLIVNPSLQQEYSTSVKNLSDKRKNLMGELKKLSGLTSRTETPDIVLATDVGATKEDLPERIEALIEGDYAVAHLQGVKYAEVFNHKTLKILEKEDVQAPLEEYVELYNKLVKESPIFCHTFNHQGATAVSKGLKDAGFYTAGHFVTLKVEGSFKEVSSSEELEKTFQQEREKILADESLKKRFDAVDKALGNADTKKLRALIASNKELLADLKNLEMLKKKFWYAYFQECKEKSNEFLDASRETKKVRADLVASAEQEETKWTKVIQIFNRRFDVPFNISIQNQAGVILEGEKPVKSFSFKKDSEAADGVNEKELLSVLSQGERRALYILNLLFEIETRKETKQETLFIIDDIADSFDYRNKYAIVEYLYELSKQDKFSFLFLTHNFDFHRTVASRLGLQRQECLVATKGAKGIDLQEEKYQNNVFLYWRENMHSNEHIFIACIPFVRNLAEYIGQGEVVKSLTQVLHIKNGSDSKTYNDLINDFTKVFRDDLPTISYNGEDRVLDRIQTIAGKISRNKADHIELENKIILAMAIRLMAEKYMFNRLSNPDREIKSNQTRELFDAFSDKFSSENDVISTLDQVNIMTPENIHINSFMFEPILDMSSGHLYRLHADLKQLIETEELNEEKRRDATSRLP